MNTDFRSFVLMQSIWQIVVNNKNISILVLIILSLVSFLPSLGVFDPSLMEARNFVTAREMVQEGNWLLPTMNGEPRIAKPPLPTWITALVMLIVGSTDNVFLLRLPAVFAGIVLVLSAFGFARTQTKDNDLAFLTGSVAATSLLILQMSKTGSWDIHCHAWMLAGICCWVQSLSSEKVKTNWLVLSALFMGLSFLSKGPVSFYTLLLPFLIASIATKKFGMKRLSFIQGFAFFIILLIISGWWPAYVFFNKAEIGIEVAKTEATAWANRHVRPFYFYFHFPVYIGVWAIPFIASLFWKYAKSKFIIKSDYVFLIVWILSALLLLSVIPEKKERYMLPLIVPMALMVGRIIYNGIVKNELEGLTKGDRVFYTIHSFAILVFNFSALGFIYKFGILEQNISWLLFTLYIVVVLFINYGLIKSRLNLRNLFLLSIVSQLVIGIIVLPVTPLYAYPNKSYESLERLNTNEEIKRLELFSWGELNVKHVFALKRTVKSIDTKERIIFPKDWPVAIISAGPLSSYLNNEWKQKLKITEVERINASRKKENDVLHISIVDLK